MYIAVTIQPDNDLQQRAPLHILLNDRDGGGHVFLFILLGGHSITKYQIR
jgi:hypothetical protein